MKGQLKAGDVLLFILLEMLGLSAIVGNLLLIAVLLRHNYLNKASLAIADVLHGLVTASFFYPPIVLKRNHMPTLGVRIFNLVDWTAWGITLSYAPYSNRWDPCRHMSAICIDRLIAILVFGRYNVIVTTRRMKTYSITCWITFVSLNFVCFLANFCCPITPLDSHEFYSFGYNQKGKFLANSILLSNFVNDTGDHASSPMNIYIRIYTPLEVATLCILSISSPTTLIQLYRRYKRKTTLRMASRLLLEMSIKMGNQLCNNDVREIAARRANAQQQRIFVQITLVAVIFYCYMTAYYLTFYVLDADSLLMVISNSLCYSITHMINPVVYFGLNADMRRQLLVMIARCLGRVDERTADAFTKSTCRRAISITTATETSPLFSAVHRSVAAPRERLISSLVTIVDASQSMAVSQASLIEEQSPIETVPQRTWRSFSIVQWPMAKVAIVRRQLVRSKTLPLNDPAICSTSSKKFIQRHLLFSFSSHLRRTRSCEECKLFGDSLIRSSQSMWADGRRLLQRIQLKDGDKEESKICWSPRTDSTNDSSNSFQGNNGPVGSLQNLMNNENEEDDDIVFL